MEGELFLACWRVSAYPTHSKHGKNDYDGLWKARHGKWRNSGGSLACLLALFHLFECCIVSFYFCQASRAIFCRVSSYIILLFVHNLM